MKFREAIESGSAAPMSHEDWVALRAEATRGFGRRDSSPVSRIIRRPSANRDLVTIFRHYAREAGIRVADRFFAEAEATFARLGSMPGIGTRYEPAEPLYADLRYFPISRFRVYLGF